MIAGCRNSKKGAPAPFFSAAVSFAGGQARQSGTCQSRRALTAVREKTDAGQAKSADGLHALPQRFGQFGSVCLELPQNWKLTGPHLADPVMIRTAGRAAGELKRRETRVQRIKPQLDQTQRCEFRCQTEKLTSMEMEMSLSWTGTSLLRPSAAFRQFWAVQARNRSASRWILTYC